MNKEFKNTCELIETWNKKNIELALTSVKNIPEIKEQLVKRYSPILEGLGTKTIKTLASIQSRWDKMNNQNRASLLYYWPKEVPFFTDKIDLSAKLRVDQWRDSHYSNQINLELVEGSLGKLKGVKEIAFKHQQWTSLPSDLFQLKELEDLDLHDNDFKELPKQLLKFKNLKTLNLHQNYLLEKVPDLGELKSLEYLDITYTQLNHLGDSFLGLNNLKELTLMNSDLDKNTDFVRELVANIPSLKINSRALKAIEIEDADDSEFLGEEYIDIRDWEINRLPKSLFKADVVKILSIDAYSLKEIDNRFENLQTLEELSIKVGQITQLPNSICKLKNLKKLEIEIIGNEPVTLPKNLGELGKLVELSLNGPFETLPESFTRLQALEKLRIESFFLVHIPGNIGELINLKELEFENLGNHNDAVITIHQDLRTLKNVENLQLKISSGKIETEEIIKLPQCISRFTLESRSECFNLDLGSILNHFDKLTYFSSDNIIYLNNQSKFEKHPFLKSITLCRTPWIMPDSMGQLDALEEATFLSCGLKQVNASIYECEKLSYLRIEDSELVEVPKGIEKLQYLKYFGVERSAIEELPKGIFELSNLKEITLGGAPIWLNKPFKETLIRKIKGIKIKKNWY